MRETRETKRQKFETALDDLDKEFETWLDTVHEAERLTSDDLALRINASTPQP